MDGWMGGWVDGKKDARREVSSFFLHSNAVEMMMSYQYTN